MGIEKYTHNDFKAMKKDLKITNHDIAEITGLKYDSVRQCTARSKELPAWIKTMIYVWKQK